jgi:hypothetical protein
MAFFVILGYMYEGRWVSFWLVHTLPALPTNAARYTLGWVWIFFFFDTLVFAPCFSCRTSVVAIAFFLFSLSLGFDAMSPGLS